jgi:hypothetical protein
MEFDLTPIIDWNMNEIEAKAFKTGLFWLKYSREYYPNYRHTSRYPSKGDPRKSSLFKYCLKLHRDSGNTISDNNIKLYVIAQLQVLKAVKVDGAHPLIEPNCLAGDKAWRRWLMWKSKYDKLSKTSTKEDVNLDVVSPEQINKDLEFTKKFLYSKFDGTENQFKKISKEIGVWAFNQKISPFYCIMSPWFQKYCNVTNIDFDVYKKSVTLEVKNQFLKVFPEEFKVANIAGPF